MGSSNYDNLNYYSNESSELPEEEYCEDLTANIKKATDDKEDLRHLAKSILLGTSKKYLKLVNDQIFIYNRDTGLFEILQNPSKEALSQINNIYCDKFINEYDDGIRMHINHVALRKIILDKICQNKNLYCGKDINNPSQSVIPLLDKRMFFGNQKEGKLKPNHLAFTSLDYCLSTQIESKINRLRNSRHLQEYPYITFLKSIQNSTSNTGNVGSYAHMLFKDIAMNVPTYSGKMCYVISCDDKIMQEIFWVPIDNMVPSSYKTYMSFHNSEVRKHASNMVGKAINIHIGLPSEMNKNQKMFLCENLLRCVPITLFYPKSSYNYINRTIQVFLVNTSEAEMLMKIFEDFSVNGLAQLIKLPQIKDLEKPLQDKLNEPDFIEELLSDKDGIINLLYSDWSKTNDNEALQKLTYIDSKENFIEKYLEFTGKESDMVSKKDLHQFYCKNYPTDYSGESVFNRFLKSYMSLYIDRTSFKKLNISEQVGRFTEIRKGVVYYWVGIRVKEKDNIFSDDN